LPNAIPEKQYFRRAFAAAVVGVLRARPNDVSQAGSRRARSTQTSLNKRRQRTPATCREYKKPRIAATSEHQQHDDAEVVRRSCVPGALFHSIDLSFNIAEFLYKKVAAGLKIN